MGDTPLPQANTPRPTPVPTVTPDAQPIEVKLVLPMGGPATLTIPSKPAGTPAPDVSAQVQPTGGAAPASQPAAPVATAPAAENVHYFHVDQQKQLEAAEARIKQARELIDKVKSSGALTGGLDTNASDAELKQLAEKVAAARTNLDWRSVNSAWIDAHKNDSDLNKPTNWDKSKKGLQCDYIKKEATEIAAEQFSSTPRQLAQDVAEAFKTIKEGMPPSLMAIRELQNQGHKVEFKTTEEMQQVLAQKKPDSAAPALTPQGDPAKPDAAKPDANANLSPELRQALAQAEQEAKAAVAKAKAEQLDKKIDSFHQLLTERKSDEALAVAKAMSPDELKEFQARYEQRLQGGMRADVRSVSASKEWDSLIGPDTIDTVANRYYMRQVNGSIPESGPITTQELAKTLVSAISSRNKMAAFSIINGRTEEEIARLDSAVKEQSNGISITQLARNSYWTVDDRAMLDGRMKGFNPTTHSDEVYSAVNGGGTAVWKVHYALVGLSGEQSNSVADKFGSTYSDSMVKRLTLCEISGADLSPVKFEIPFAHDLKGTADGIHWSLDSSWYDVSGWGGDDDYMVKMIVETLNDQQLLELNQYMATHEGGRKHTLKKYVQDDVSEGGDKNYIINRINEAERKAAAQTAQP